MPSPSSRGSDAYRVERLQISLRSHLHLHRLGLRRNTSLWFQRDLEKNQERVKRHSSGPGYSIEHDRRSVQLASLLAAGYPRHTPTYCKFAPFNSKTNCMTSHARDQHILPAGAEKQTSKKTVTLPSMSDKKPGRGRGRSYRPNVSEAVPLPSQEVVEDLLKDVPVGDAIDDGMGV